ncbi:hypothetical protein ANTPLA_LOCUS7283 [Anthophora plagiata]
MTYSTYLLPGTKNESSSSLDDESSGKKHGARFNIDNMATTKFVAGLDEGLERDDGVGMMRGDPMVDENGNEIEEIGEDLSGPPHMEEAYEIMQQKGYLYYMPRLKV